MLEPFEVKSTEANNFLDFKRSYKILHSPFQRRATSLMKSYKTFLTVMSSKNNRFVCLFYVVVLLFWGHTQSWIQGLQQVVLRTTMIVPCMASTFSVPFSWSLYAYHKYIFTFISWNSWFPISGGMAKKTIVRPPELSMEVYCYIIVLYQIDAQGLKGCANSGRSKMTNLKKSSEHLYHCSQEPILLPGDHRDGGQEDQFVVGRFP